MSPTNLSNTNDTNNTNNPDDTNKPNNTPAGTNVIVSNSDLRCRLCGHNRSKCSICQTPRSHSSAPDRRKAKKVPKTRRRRAYCCKCKHKSKLVRFFDPDHKEKLALIKFTGLKIDAAARLRSYILQALKSEKCHQCPTTCRGFSGMGNGYDRGSPGSGGPSLFVFNCQIPDHSNLDVSLVLEYRVIQVERTALRLSLLLSSDHPIDTGILRTVLQTLFNQLATLTHRAFPSLTPDVLSNRKAFQHSLRVAGRGVQAAYKELWAAALLTGMLRRDAQVMESGGRSIVSSHEIGVQQLLWRAREVADELRLWLALLRAGMSS